jgi:hypothetical protein
MKQTLITVALYADTAEMLSAIAKHQAKSVDSLVDQLVEEEYYRTFIVPTLREAQGK